MTLIDLILLSSGIKKDGDSYSIDVFRKSYDKSGENPYKVYFVNLNNESLSSELDYKKPEYDFLLERNDLVVVRQKEGITKSAFVTINGLVKTPGVYAILNNKYSLFDLLNDSGGILKDGALNGVKIKRVNRLRKKKLKKPLLRPIHLVLKSPRSMIISNLV
jgi:protein involved in polysaccharide export with SLBB domain